ILKERQQRPRLDLGSACQSSDPNGTIPDGRRSRIAGELFPQEPSALHAPTADSCWEKSFPPAISLAVPTRRSAEHGSVPVGSSATVPQPGLGSRWGRPSPLWKSGPSDRHKGGGRPPSPARPPCIRV